MYADHSPADEKSREIKGEQILKKVSEPFKAKSRKHDDY